LSEFVTIPISIANFLGSVAFAKKKTECYKENIFFVFVALSWVIWRIHNKMAIEKNFSSGIDALFSGISLLLKWMSLLKEKDTEQVNEVIKKFHFNDFKRTLLKFDFVYLY
jgi:hypothetical protein